VSGETLFLEYETVLKRPTQRTISGGSEQDDLPAELVRVRPLSEPIDASISGALPAPEIADDQRLIRHRR
jgi:hypothetical protein